MSRCRLQFASGGLLFEPQGVDISALEPLLSTWIWDARVGAYRTEALQYRTLILHLHRHKIPYDDQARAYETLALKPHFERKPFNYQKAALDAWDANQGAGIVVLPTGSGKSFVAYLAILAKQRATLVITPTLELMLQWQRGMESYFKTPVGLVGGGTYDPQPLTVTTYDSAYLHMDKLGAQFGMLVFDEVHHLPSPSYALAAKHSIAPFRMGLSATPERDTQAYTYESLLGPIVYQKDIKDLAGHRLAEYETVTLSVALDDDERDAYAQARAEYLAFIRSNGIRMNSRNGWQEFIRTAAQSVEGRSALKAHRMQHRITQCSRQKIALLIELLAEHREDRTIVFTQDNETVYKISRELLLPAITHQSSAKERRHILDAFASGDYPVIVTSKVLNEGVDIPEASVAIVLSGSGSVREHVQRLGRILRAKEGKSAVLYECIAQGTTEESVSERRRQHEAYQ